MARVIGLDPRSIRRALVLAAVALWAAAVLGWATPAQAAGWSPEPATFGVGETQNVTVTMPDGTGLRANVYYPTDPRTGAAAPGPFSSAATVG